jgi:hypothetical protein
MLKKLRQIPTDLKSGEPLQVGGALTKSFLMAIILLAILPQYTAESGWQFRFWAFLLSPPNEIGDTLAGIAGVLAFLWIIITVWLQSIELKEQRKELSEQRKATQEIAKRMDQQSAKEHLDALLLSLRRKVLNVENSISTWKWTRNSKVEEHCLIPESLKELSEEEIFFPTLRQHVLNALALSTAAKQGRDGYTDLQPAFSNVSLFFADSFLDAFTDLRKRLGADQTVRIVDLEVEDLLRLLQHLRDADIWSEQHGIRG